MVFDFQGGVVDLVTFQAPTGAKTAGEILLPSFAESHGCKPVDECEVGTLRSLGEGG